MMEYNDIINHIANQEDEDIVWKFKFIVVHEVPLKNSHTNYKGSCYNMYPLCIIASYYPVICSLCDYEKLLLQQ